MLDDFFVRSEWLQLDAAPEIDALSTALRSAICLALNLGGGGEMSQERKAPTLVRLVGAVRGLLSPRRARSASAHPVLQYVYSLGVTLNGNLKCDINARLVPLTSTAPVIDRINFDNLWFTLPVLERRLLVNVSGGDPPLDHAFFEVLDCVCFQPPVTPTSRPVWDLEKAMHRGVAYERSVGDLFDCG